MPSSSTSDGTAYSVSAVDVQPLAARRQNPQPRTRRDEVGDERRRGDQPLEVVEHQKELSVAEATDERVGGGLAGLLGDA